MSLAESSSAGERGQWRAPHNIQTVTQDVNGGLRGSRTKSPGCVSLIVFMACVRQQEILRVQKRLSLTRPALSLNALAWRAKAAYLLHELTVLPRQCPVQWDPGFRNPHPRLLHGNSPAADYLSTLLGIGQDSMACLTNQ